MVEISESEGLRIRSSDIRGREKMGISAQEERENLPFLHHFVPFGTPMDWPMPTIFVGKCLHSAY